MREKGRKEKRNYSDGGRKNGRERDWEGEG